VVDARYPGVELRRVDEQHRIVERVCVVEPPAEQLFVAECGAVAELAAVDEAVADRAYRRMTSSLLA